MKGLFKNLVKYKIFGININLLKFIIYGEGNWEKLVYEILNFSKYFKFNWFLFDLVL